MCVELIKNLIYNNLMEELNLRFVIQWNNYFKFIIFAN